MSYITIKDNDGNSYKITIDDAIDNALTEGAVVERSLAEMLVIPNVYVYDATSWHEQMDAEYQRQLDHQIEHVLKERQRIFNNAIGFDYFEN